MKKISLILVSMIVVLNSLNGQEKWSLRTNAGVASGSSIIDGYYFSFDIGIPIIKSLEISPTFSNASMLPNTFVYNSWTLVTF